VKRYRDEPVLMKCGHPRAAREIVVVQEDGRFRTECWACRIERENKR
jgi:hypothetical protein